MKPFVLVVIATNRELEACRLLLERTHKSRMTSGGDRFLVEFDLLYVLIVKLSAMGTLEASVAVAGLIRQYRPICVVGCGICAATQVKENPRNPCDLMVATRVVYYEPEKQLPGLLKEWRPRAFKVVLPPKVLKKLCPKASHLPAHISPPKKFSGPFACGERVLADEEAVDDLRQRAVKEYGEDIIAIDMESAGIARACGTTGTRFVIAKAVSDFGTKSKNDDWQYAAATLSIDSVLSWLKTFTVEDIGAIRLPVSENVEQDPLAKASRLLSLAGYMLPPHGVREFEVEDRGIDDLITPVDRSVGDFFQQHLTCNEAGDVHFFIEDKTPDDRARDVLSGRWWIIDPVDGTQNLVAARPEVAISVAFYVEGEAEFAVVGMPYRELIVAATRGRELEINGHPWVSGRSAPRDIGEAVVALPGDLRRLRVLKNVSATPGVSRRLEARKNVGINPACPRRLKPHTNNADPCEIIAKVARKVAGIRVTGALAYDLACLVLGEIDARISTSAKLVDVAAGACLIRRNKGVVTDLLGNEWKPGSCTLVAARTKRLHDQLMDLLILG